MEDGGLPRSDCSGSDSSRSEPLPFENVKAAMSEIVGWWHASVRSTEPLDRDLIRRTVDELYGLMRLPPPRLVFCQSPYQLLLLPLAVNLRVTGHELEAIPHWQGMRDVAFEQLGFDLLAPDHDFDLIEEGELGLESPFWNLHLADCLDSTVNSKALSSLFLDRPSKLHAKGQSIFLEQSMILFRQDIIACIRRELAGSFPVDLIPDGLARRSPFHDGGWLFARDGSQLQLAIMLGAELPPDRQAVLDILIALQKGASYFNLFERHAFVSERPVAVHVQSFVHDESFAEDPIGRFHNDSGPAFSYSDGFSYYAYRGIPVPADLIERRHEIAAFSIISEPNAELRTAMLGLFGEERFIEESGASVIDSSELGTLYRYDFEPPSDRWPSKEPLLMVRVQNATLEPDGTRKPYILRVPPGVGTVREAIAWTFGMREEEYHPTEES